MVGMQYDCRERVDAVKRNWEFRALPIGSRTTYRWMTAFGFDPRVFLFGLKGLPAFARDYLEFKRMLKSMRAEWPLHVNAPCLADRWRSSGEARGHYFHQDLFVAQKIFKRNPSRHVDVGSRVDGFVAHVASFRAITVLDIRPPPRAVRNIEFLRQDMSEMPDTLQGIADSVSCLHALEHFGLGRYGDPLNASGHVKGLRAIGRLLAPGGTLYLSVPIGDQRIEFNGHRVFSIRTVLELAKAEKLDLLTFSYVDDDGAFHEDVALGADARGFLPRLRYGCGIFEFARKGISDSIDGS